MISKSSHARDIVLAFIQSLNQEDFEMARRYAHDDMNFVGVLGSRQGAESYFKDMEKMKLKYDIKKVFADEREVCLLYDLNLSDKTLFCCGWYKVTNGKISSLRVVFDPRPVLEPALAKQAGK